MELIYLTRTLSLLASSIAMFHRYTYRYTFDVDLSLFLDFANIWGVDYDSSIDDGSKIRSSIGIGIDWLTVVGPLSFSFSKAISKADSDVEETFRFNLGTSF